MALYGKIKRKGVDNSILHTSPSRTFIYWNLSPLHTLLAEELQIYFFSIQASQLECSLPLNSSQDKCGPGSEKTACYLEELSSSLCTTFTTAVICVGTGRGLAWWGSEGGSVIAKGIPGTALVGALASLP